MAELLTRREIRKLGQVERIMMEDILGAVRLEIVKGREGGKPPITIGDAMALGDIYQEFTEALEELKKNRTL